MPISSKSIVVTASENIDGALVRILNRNSGDIWGGAFSTDTIIIDLANNNIWGDEPTQWVVGDVLEITVFAVKKGGTTFTIVDGINSPNVTMNTDTAVDIAF